jgi:prevent-host-death family protein
MDQIGQISENAMRSVTAHDAKARFGQLLEAARNGPVTIERHGREVAVLISKEEFDALQDLKLQHLRSEVQKGLADLEAGRFTELDAAALKDFGGAVKNAARKQTSSK